jgi:hypothetical protein
MDRGRRHLLIARGDRGGDGVMRASLTRDGREVGVFIMTRDGDYSWDCLDEERERLAESVKVV